MNIIEHKSNKHIHTRWFPKITIIRISGRLEPGGKSAELEMYFGFGEQWKSSLVRIH